MSIRVSHQDPETHLLIRRLIYDNREANGNMNTIVADSGYIRLSDDKKYLLVTLLPRRNLRTDPQQPVVHEERPAPPHVDLQKQVIRWIGFAMGRSDADMFSNAQTKNINELQHDIDSLEIRVNDATTTSYEPLLKEQIFARDNTVLPLPDSLQVDKSNYRDLLATGFAARTPDPREGEGLEPGPHAGQELAEHVRLRRVDGQGGPQPVVPLEDRVAPQDLAPGLDPDLLPDRRTARGDHPPRRSGDFRSSCR